MAITDINISDTLETDAPSIKYTGNEGPQASPQHQQEQMIAQQIWEALGPEQQGQFQSFEQFFQSGIWKQILQQMQADEGRGPETQQGIGSLGPQPMEQQMPMPRMGAQYGGRMGYQGGEMVEGMTEGIEKVGRGGSEIIEKIKEGIIAGGDRAMGIPGVDESVFIRTIKYLMNEHGLSKEEAFERVLPKFRKNIDPGFAPIRSIGGGRNIDPDFAPIRPIGGGRNIDPGFERLEDIDIEGIETLRGRR
jgi:hypothetical protein